MEGGHLENYFLVISERAERCLFINEILDWRARKGGGEGGGGGGIKCNCSKR